MKMQIRFLKGTEKLNLMEYKRFQRGDTIFGIDSEPELVKCWVVDDLYNSESELKEANNELESHSCTYELLPNRKEIFVEEYALAYDFIDSDGDFLYSHGYDLAEAFDEIVPIKK